MVALYFLLNYYLYYNYYLLSVFLILIYFKLVLATIGTTGLKGTRAQ